MRLIMELVTPYCNTKISGHERPVVFAGEKKRREALGRPGVSGDSMDPPHIRRMTIA
jgi:hypothetical protein